MSNRLLKSFGAVYVLLEQPRAARRVVAALLVIHTILLAYSAYVHSPTLNEPAHLVAGLSYWKFGRFDLYCVNPPLVRLVAALPVVATGYKEDWNRFYERPGARPERGMGDAFVKANGERSFFLFTVARWGCIPFSWIGAIICYLWGRDLYGRPSGVMACGIWCFEPNILAHAALITADAAGTSMGIAACYTFWRWLKRPTWTQAALTGVILGLAELAKSTLILFFPLWPIMWIAYRFHDRRSIPGCELLRQAGMLCLRMVIGLYILNLGYGFQGSLTKLEDFHFVSNLFTKACPGSLSLEEKATNAHQPVRVNRFASTWLGKVPVPLARDYLLGIDLQQRDFERGGRPSYIRGQWRDHGWWYYYLYACAIKVPLSLWGSGIIGTIIIIKRLIRKMLNQCENSSSLPADGKVAYATPYDEIILLFPAFTIFIVVSYKTGFTEHLRYVLPCFPFLFVWLGQVARIHGLCATSFRRRCLTGSTTFPYKADDQSHACELRNSSACTATCSTSLVALLGVWFIVSSFWIYPHSLSYFNESIGGPLNGPRHLLGSNIDWGQDLRYLKWNLGKHSRCLYVAYVGFFDLSNLGIECNRISVNATSDTSAIAEPGSYVITVNCLQKFASLTKSIVDDQEFRTSTLQVFCPNHVIPVGYSMLVFPEIVR